jgi:hypothetical protein
LGAFCRGRCTFNASNRQGQPDALRADADAKHREYVATEQWSLLDKLVELRELEGAEEQLTDSEATLRERTELFRAGRDSAGSGYSAADTRRSRELPPTWATR